MKLVHRCIKRAFRTVSDFLVIRDLPSLVRERHLPTRFCVLRGNRLRFPYLVGDLLLHVRSDPNLEPARLLDVARQLRQRLPVDEARPDGAGFVAPALRRTRSPDAPTPFLPFVIELEGLRRDPGSVDDASLSRLLAYSSALLESMQNSRDEVRAAGVLLATVLDVLRSVNALPTAMHVALRAGFVFDSLAAMPDERALALPDLLDGVYEVLNEYWASEDSVDRMARYSIAAGMLAFVEDALAPATIARNRIYTTIAARGGNGSDVATAELNRSNLALEHRRRSWHSAVAVEGKTYSLDRTQDWLRLADAYEEIEDPLNAAGAVCNGLDRTLEAFQQNGRLHLAHDELASLAARADQLLPKRLAAPPEVLLAFEKPILRGFIAVNDHANADVVLCRALTCLRAGLGQGDFFRRNYFARDAEDWLGLAGAADIACFGVPRNRFEQAHRIVRGRQPIQRAPIGMGVVSPYITRTRAFSSTVVGNAQLWTETQPAHPVVTTVKLLADLTARECNLRRQSANALAPDPGWERLLQRMAGQLLVGKSLRPLRRPSAPGRLIVDVDGAALHVPWSGLITNIGARVDAVLSCPGGIRSTTRPSPNSQDRSLLLNAFSLGDPWHQPARRIARMLGAAHQVVNTLDDFRAQLREPAKFLILCCHGSQPRLSDEPSIQISGRLVPVSEALHGVELSRAATIALVICYGGAGFLPAAGRWVSLPALLLEAGARAVVASRWPAWDELHVRDPMDALLQAVQTSAVQSCWHTAAALTSWLAQQRMGGLEPRYWAGWNVWAAPSIREEQ